MQQRIGNSLTTMLKFVVAQNFHFIYVLRKLEKSPEKIMNSSIKTPAANQPISRRSFLDYLLGGGLLALVVGIVYPVLRFVMPPELPEAVQSSVVAAKVGDLKPNSGRIFRFGKGPGILILTDSSEYRAFGATCTHLSCTVQYRADLKEIWCACHNGYYDLNGKNISGPPPRPLPRYNVAVRGDNIVVTKS